MSISAGAQSDPTGFQTVINIPEDQAVLSGTLGANTQVNLSEGGRLGNYRLGDPDRTTVNAEFNMSGGSAGIFQRVWPGVTANISGGTVGAFFGVAGGATVNFSGGDVDRNLVAVTNAIINVSGGKFGPRFQALPGSDVELIGGDFQLDGLDIDANGGGQINFAEGSTRVFTGTFADGSAFIFSGLADDYLWQVGLTETPLPPIDTTLRVVNSETVPPASLRRGQSLLLREGGALPDRFAAVDAMIQIEGGEWGVYGEVADTDITMAGGEIRSFLDLFNESTLKVTGGRVGSALDVYSGSRLEVNGGTVRGNLTAHRNSVVQLTSGEIEFGFDVEAGAHFEMLGGRAEAFLVKAAGTARVEGGKIVSMDTVPSSDVELIGGEFAMNGDPYMGNTVSLLATTKNVFTGTLADGTTFVLSPNTSDLLSDVRLTRVALPTADPTPIRVGADTNPAPTGLRAGQTLTLETGGVLPEDFAAIDAQLIVEGGSVGNGLELAKSDLILHDGSIGSRLLAYDQTTIDIHGGQVDSGLQALAGSVINIYGGLVGSRDEITRLRSSRFNADATLNLFGRQFFLNGIELLMVDGETRPVIERDGFTLSGVLSDGKHFEFELASERSEIGPIFSIDALLSITRVAYRHGDYDNNGTVDQEDLNLVLNNWGGNRTFDDGTTPFATTNVDQEELNLVLSNWGSSSAPSFAGFENIPEPAGLAALAGFAFYATRRRG
ncbi:MAG: hypothetical protein AAGF84_03540 [Planctomycetota bacterium]